MMQCSVYLLVKSFLPSILSLRFELCQVVRLFFLLRYFSSVSSTSQSISKNNSFRQHLVMNDRFLFAFCAATLKRCKMAGQSRIKTNLLRLSDLSPPLVLFCSISLCHIFDFLVPSQHFSFPSLMQLQLCATGQTMWNF